MKIAAAIVAATLAFPVESARAEYPAPVYQLTAIEIGATDPGGPTSWTMSAGEAKAALKAVKASGGKIIHHPASASGVSEAGRASFEIVGKRYEIDEAGSVASGTLPTSNSAVATAKVGRTLYLISLGRLR